MQENVLLHEPISSPNTTFSRCKVNNKSRWLTFEYINRRFKSKTTSCINKRTRKWPRAEHGWYCVPAAGTVETWPNCQNPVNQSSHSTKVWIIIICLSNYPRCHHMRWCLDKDGGDITSLCPPIIIVNIMYWLLCSWMWAHIALLIQYPICKVIEYIDFKRQVHNPMLELLLLNTQKSSCNVQYLAQPN